MRLECVLERCLVIVGLTSGCTSTAQRICHVSLERPDCVKTIDTIPTKIGADAAACRVDNALYLVGTGGGYNKVWRCSAESEWEACKDMPLRRYRHSVAAVDSTLFVLGGVVDNTNTPVSNILTFDTKTNEWSAAGQLAHAVRNPACVAFQNFIYIFGGADKYGKNLDCVQKYDTVQQKCTVQSDSMPYAQCWMRAILCGDTTDYAVVIGSETCLIYNFKTQSWLERKQFKTDVDIFGAVIEGATLFIAGGGKRDKNNKKTWICTDEIKSVPLSNVMDDKPAVWKHHAKLPQPALVQAHDLMFTYV